MNTKAVGQPRHGEEVKKVYSIRIEPRLYAEIIKKFGKFSCFMDSALEEFILSEKPINFYQTKYKEKE